MKWKLSDLSLAVVDAMTEASVMTVEVTTPNGIISIMGEPREVGRALVVEGVHIQSSGSNPTTSASETCARSRP